MARRKKEDDEKPDPFANGTNDAAEILMELIEKIENITATINEHQGEIREIMQEAGARGFNTRVIRRILARRKALRMNKMRVESDDYEFDTYMSAIGLGEY